MDKNVIRIFILGFIWVMAGIFSFTIKKDEQSGTLLLAIGLVIESVALLVFIWKKMKQK
jgi:Kef-type K+ transport system membrane component KefB